MSYSKMYIAVLDDAPDYMVPTLVAHSVLGAHFYFTSDYKVLESDRLEYQNWFDYSYRKVVVRVNQKEFDKIYGTTLCFSGYENTICNGEASCLVVLPVNSGEVPNVLKYARMWKPKGV